MLTEERTSTARKCLVGKGVRGDGGGIVFWLRFASCENHCTFVIQAPLSL